MGNSDGYAIKLRQFVGVRWQLRELIELVEAAYEHTINDFLEILYRNLRYNGITLSANQRSQVRSYFLDNIHIREFFAEEVKFLSAISPSRSILSEIIPSRETYVSSGGSFYRVLMQELDNWLGSWENFSNWDKKMRRNVLLNNNLHLVFYQYLFNSLSARTVLRLVYDQDVKAGKTSIELTISRLESDIVPVLKALATLNEVALVLSSSERYSPRITSISQNSPVKVNLESPLVREVREEAHPVIENWRLEHARQMGDLEVAIKEASVIQAKAEAAKARAEAQQIKASTQNELAEAERILGEAAVLREEAEAKRIANEKARIELEFEKLLLAQKVLAVFAPYSEEMYRLVFVNEILPAIVTLVHSDVHVKFPYLESNDKL